MKNAPRSFWPALVFVGCAHALTTAGTWLVSDHAELLFMGRRLLDRGTLTLGEAGERLPGLPWVRVEPDQPTRSRLFPGTAVAYLPLILLDRLFGLEHPVEQGRLVHAGGHLFVLGALGVLGSALVHSGASPQAAALAIALLGTAWPIWQIGRHGGAEPVVAFLFAVFLYGRARAQPKLQAGVNLLLPSVHPTGCVLAAVLGLHAVAEARFCDRPNGPKLASALRILLAGCIGVAAVAVLWNLRYHGHWWGGGYATQGATSGFFAAPPGQVLVYYLSEAALHAPLLLTLAAAGGLAAGRRGARELFLPLVVLAAYLALFALFSTPAGQEPARRLSVVWLAFGYVVGRTWDDLRLRGLVPLGMVTMSLCLGFYWFLLREWNYYPRPEGGYYPLVLWVTLARQRQPAFFHSFVPLLLAFAGCAAMIQLARLFAAPTSRPDSSNGTSVS